MDGSSLSTLIPENQLGHLTISSITESLTSGEFTVVDLISAHLNLIRRFNDEVRAVVEVNSDALKVASERDEELRVWRTEGKRLGRLHGIPVLVKNNVNTKEFAATAGCLALVGARPARENDAITRLRDEGAIILGATNLSEWANWRCHDFEDNGWSATFGQTYGAYHEKMEPAGSSSGSGVGVDLGMGALAVGTETWGSIVCPASKNNIVGIKPTVGSVPANSVIPIAPSQDTLGPMARSVIDATTMLEVMTGTDSGLLDWARLATEERKKSLANIRVGVPRSALDDVPKCMMDHFETVLSKLRGVGMQVVDVTFPCVEKFKELESRGDECANLAPEFRVGLEEYLSTLVTNPHDIKTIQDIVDFTMNEPGEEYPKRDIYWLSRSARLNLSSPEYVQGLEDSKFFAGEGGILGAIQAHALDAIVAPSSADLVNYSAARGGLPAVSIPMGYMPEDTPAVVNRTGNLVTQGSNIPFGFSVLGPGRSESTLLKVAFAVEELADVRATADEHRLERFRL